MHQKQGSITLLPEDDVGHIYKVCQESGLHTLIRENNLSVWGPAETVDAVLAGVANARTPAPIPLTAPSL